MEKIGFYFVDFLRGVGIYFDYFIGESGILLFIVILLGVILMVWLVWQKIKIKKIQADFYQNRLLKIE